MKNKYKRVLAFIMLALLLIVSKNFPFAISFSAGSFLLLIFFQYVSRKFFDKFEIFNGKIDRLYLCIVSLIFIIIFICTNRKIAFGLDMLIIGGNFFALLLTNFFIFQFCFRKSGRKFAYISSLFSIVFLSLLFYIYKDNIYFLTVLFPIGILYLYDTFDFANIIRKKNIAKIFIIYLFMLSLIFFNEFSVFLIFYLLFLVINKKNSLKHKVAVVLLFLPAFAFYIVRMVLLFKGFNSIDENPSLYFISILIFNFVSIVKNSFVDGKKGKVLALEYLYVFIVLCLVKNCTYILPIVPLIITYIALTIDKIIFNPFKFFVPKQIKKVSAVIPNYNYANYIIERIDSILNQNYPVFELIILDDCSSDNSEEVILKKIAEIKQIRPELSVIYIPNQKNSGNVFKQWAKCFEVSSGDYVWICEADDSCNKYFLNTVMKGFNDEQVVLSYSESLTIDEKNKVMEENLRPWIDIYNTGKWDKNYITNGVDELKKLCINNTIANVSSVVFKNDKKINFKEYLKKAQDFVLAGDWYFYSKVLLHGKIAYFNESLNYHRMHSCSVTNTTDNFIHYKEVVFVQDSIRHDVEISSKTYDLMADRVKHLKSYLCISDDELYYDKIDLNDLTMKKHINDNVLLSVIIPVYNVEPYIDKCLKSVFRALPDRTEVIVINDGSPDNSEEIILKYKEKYNNLIYVKKENGGLSSAKNRGLKEAKGRYIIFLDSDDYVSCNMHSTMLKKAIDKDSDFVYCDISMVFEDGSVKNCNVTNYSRKNKLMQLLDNNLMAASWNKMIKRELYNDIIFPEGINNEDVAVSPLLMLKANNIQKVESPFYKYLQRSGSIQNSGFSEKRFMIFDAARICLDSIKDYGYVEREMVEGAIATHQLLALLIWPISGIPNKSERIHLIKVFCEKYNALNINKNNCYVIEYLHSLNKIKLLKYIEEINYKKIDSLIRTMVLKRIIVSVVRISVQNVKKLF